MPQFDLAVFAPQIFWFAICFAILYYSMSKVYLPRIRDILRSRNDNINENTILTANLQKEIDEINKNSVDLRDNSAKQYNLALDQSVKQSALAREESLNNIKKKIAKMLEDSKDQMKNFAEESENSSKKLSQKLVENITKKIFNKQLTAEEASALINKQ